MFLCLNCFSNVKQHIFVRNEVWNRLITFRLQWGYSSKFLCLWTTPAMLLLRLWNYADVMLLLWLFDAPDKLMLLFYNASVILPMIPQKETSKIQWICQPPISKQMKQLVEKKKKTNRLVMGMIQVCVHCASTILPLRFCYVLIMFMLFFDYVYCMLLLCFWYLVVAVLSCYFYVFTETKF